MNTNESKKATAARERGLQPASTSIVESGPDKSEAPLPLNIEAD